MRLIDAKQCEKQIKEIFKENPVAMGVFLRWIRKQPTAIEPVVRCKDCKYWAGEILGNRCRWHSGLEHIIMTPPEGFCSFGERREDT